MACRRSGCFSCQQDVRAAEADLGIEREKWQADVERLREAGEQLARALDGTRYAIKERAEWRDALYEIERLGIARRGTTAASVPRQ